MTDLSPRPGPPRATGIVRSPLVEQIIQLITERILSGELAPGTPLRQEELAAELGVSRTPLREALRVLRSDGFLTGGSGKGTLTVVSLTRERVRDIYEVRAMVDGFAAGLASRRASEDDLRTLDELSAAIQDACRPFALRRFIDVHAEFHIAVLRAAGNETLLTMEPIVQMSSRMLYPRLNTNRERMIASASEHRTIFEAIRSHRAEEAERRARGHVENAIAVWLDDGSMASKATADSPTDMSVVGE